MMLQNIPFRMNIYRNGLKRIDWEWIYVELKDSIEKERWRDMHY
jgi:hypothetical protein